MTEPYALTKELPNLDYQEAIDKVTARLAEKGFGVLTEIDVKATLKRKIGADFRRYVILGACNPELAHQALTEEPPIGVLLPCNVVVAERAEGGSVVYAFNPTAGFSLLDRDDMAPLAAQVRGLLETVLDGM